MSVLNRRPRVESHTPLPPPQDTKVTVNPFSVRQRIGLVFYFVESMRAVVSVLLVPVVIAPPQKHWSQGTIVCTTVL